jgi:hypothetical protein
VPLGSPTELLYPFEKVDDGKSLATLKTVPPIPLFSDIPPMLNIKEILRKSLREMSVVCVIER